MIIRFHIPRIAADNSPRANLRETTRLACLAYCMRELGHDVYISTCSARMRNSSRWWLFEDMFDPNRQEADAVVCQAELSKEEVPAAEQTVLVKVSEGCSRDREYLDRCDVLAAVVYDARDEAVAGNPNLLPIPFFVSDDVVNWFFEYRIITGYLNNDLKIIRDELGSSRPRSGAGFVGFQAYGRSGMARKCPEFCGFHWTSDEHGSVSERILSPADYLYILSKWKAGLDFPGDCPKCYRFAELVLMGTAVATVPRPLADTPPVTKENAILLRDWDDRDGWEDGLARVEKIVAAADEAYREGWSPMGQAKQILERLWM